MLDTVNRHIDISETLILTGDNPLSIIIIIISLFQEDNIFGTYASLTYGPRLQR